VRLNHMVPNISDQQRSSFLLNAKRSIYNGSEVLFCTVPILRKNPVICDYLRPDPHSGNSR
jgi:hypothetical protein